MTTTRRRSLGLRGSHDGSWEVRDIRCVTSAAGIYRLAGDTGEEYDLVIVGGGISGLSAAHFFLEQAGSDALRTNPRQS